MSFSPIRPEYSARTMRLVHARTRVPVSRCSKSLPVRSEQFSEARHARTDSSFDRAQRRPRVRCDLAVSQARKVGQFDGVPLICRKLVKRLTNHLLSRFSNAISFRSAAPILQIGHLMKRLGNFTAACLTGTKRIDGAAARH